MEKGRFEMPEFELHQEKNKRVKKIKKKKKKVLMPQDNTKKEQ